MIVGAPDRANEILTEHREHAIGVKMFGHPVEEMTREQLLGVIGFLVRDQQNQRDREQHRREHMRAMRRS